MSEKSGVEMLEEILHKLSFIEKRLDVMEQNIKSIANSAKMADLVNKAVGTPMEGWAAANKHSVPDVKKRIEEIKQKVSGGFKNFGFEPSDAAKLAGPPVPHRGARATKNILVKGVLKIEKGDSVVPLSGASVKIYDPKDNLVKSTRTNRAGHWMSHLQPGPYVALFEGELDGKKLLPQNKNFEVPEELPEGKIEFEVT